MLPLSSTILRTKYNSSDISEKNEQFMCPHQSCGKFYSSLADVKKHQAEFHGKFRCILCPKKTFLDTYDLRFHVVTFHGLKAQGTHICNVCHTKFGFANHLKQHLKEHIKERMLNMDIPLPRACTILKEEMKSDIIEIIETEVEVNFDNDTPLISCTELKEDQNNVFEIVENVIEDFCHCIKCKKSSVTQIVYITKTIASFVCPLCGQNSNLLID